MFACKWYDEYPLGDDAVECLDDGNGQLGEKLAAHLLATRDTDLLFAMFKGVFWLERKGSLVVKGDTTLIHALQVAIDRLESRPIFHAGAKERLASVLNDTDTQPRPLGEHEDLLWGEGNHAQCYRP